VSNSRSKSLTQAIKAKALELGFDAVGIAAAGNADPDGHFEEWLNRGYDAGMEYMARTKNERRDPSLLVPDAKTVIALSMSYYTPESEPVQTGKIKISRYARFDDYHKVIRKKIRKLRKHILTLDPQAVVHPAVDTSPVLERHWAQEAGIAWIGKSTMAISPRLGTYTFLATLITNIDLIVDERHVDRCGTCTACLDACPPGAFVKPYQLDANRCITYWNVEHRKEFTEKTPDFNNWVAGCDICQEVCPWNKFSKETNEPRFTPKESMVHLDLVKIAQNKAYVTELIQGTPLQRTGADAIQQSLKHIQTEDS